MSGGGLRRLEQLEDRTVPNAYFVSNLNDSGAGSFRAALLAAEANPGPDSIAFSVSGTIQLSSAALPTITDTVDINAASAPGYAGAPVVAVNYGQFGGITFSVGSAGSTLRGLSLVNSGGAGVTINGSGSMTIAGNYIGLMLDGSKALGNTTEGILLNASSGNTIGGTSAFDRNVISGNLGNGILFNSGSDNRVLGNYIGTDAAGKLDRGNASNGILVTNAASRNVIGGAAGNVISGNDGNGIQINNDATANEVSSNIIGLTSNGNGALGNTLDGVSIVNASGNSVGHTDPVTGIDYYDAGSVSVQPVTAWQGIRASDTLGQYLMVGTSGSNGLLFDGTIEGVGTSYLLNYPSAATTSVYGVDNLGSGTIRLVGTYKNADAATAAVKVHAFVFEGTTADLGNSAKYRTIDVPGAAYNFAHSTMGGLVVGNYDGPTQGGEPLGPGQAYIYNIATNTFVTNIVFPGSQSNTAYGIWHNGGTSYTIAGGFSPDRVNNFDDPSRPIGQAFLVDYDILSGQFSNWTAFSDPNGVNFVTHFEGISSVEKGVYTLSADSLQIGSGAPARGSWVTVAIHDDGTFGEAEWVDLNYPGVDPVTNISSSNSVYGNQVVGVVIGAGGTTSFQATVNTGFQLSNVISGNGGNGVSLFLAHDNQVAMNFIGTDSTGKIDLGNAHDGVRISGGSSGNMIGGDAMGGNDPTSHIFVRPPQGNLISGNNANGVFITDGATANTLSGNYIGTDVYGTSPLGNTFDGVAIVNADGNSLIGCLQVQDPFVYYNVIGGNGGNGVRVTDSNHTTIQANFIGLGADDATPVGNFLDGLLVDGDSAYTLLGGPIPLGNVISTNAGNGIAIRDTASNLASYNSFVGVGAFTPNMGLGNGANGVVITSTGGKILFQTNVISRNALNGVQITGDANDIQFTGNIVGLNTNATMAMGNGRSGFEIGGNAHDVEIGGALTSFSIIPYNIVSANGLNGVAILGNAHDIQVNFSRIGTDIGGNAALPNAKAGITIGAGTYLNTIGSTDPQLPTLVSGNGGNGIEIRSSNGNTVVGTMIGTDGTGTLPMPNALSGVYVSNGFNNTIGLPPYGTSTDSANIIAFNTGDGVWVDSGNENSIRGNSIFGNGALGIHLSPFANDNLSSPIITSAVVTPTDVQVLGTFSGVPYTPIRFDVYASSANGPSGQFYIGSVDGITDAQGLLGFRLDKSLTTTGFNYFTSTATLGVTSTSEFSAPVAATAGVSFPAIPDTTVEHGSTPPTIDLNVVNPGSSPIDFAVLLRDSLFELKIQYGLGSTPIWRDAHVPGAVYLPRSTGGYLVLRADGDLFIYDGGTTAGGTYITTLSQSVVRNPELLTSTFGTPLVTVENPLYEFKMKYGLTTPAGYFNAAGMKEWYLHSNNNSNPGSDDFILTSANTLIARGTNILVADFTALGWGDIYSNPDLLTGASLGTAVGMTASTSPSLGASGGSVTLVPAPGFDGRVTVTVSTGGTLPGGRSFVYTVENQIPTLNPIADQMGNHSTPIQIPLTVNDSDPDSALRSYIVEYSNPLFDIRQQYGFNTPATAADPTRGYAKFLNTANGYYSILPDNKLYKDNGSNPPSFVLDFAPFGDVYINPALLTSASRPAPTATLNHGNLFDLKTRYGLDTPPAYFNARGDRELYLASSNGSNPAGGAYGFMLKPDGKLYAFDGSSTPTGIVVADVGTDVYFNPALLTQAQPTQVGDSLYALKVKYGFNYADAYYDPAQGINEKYLYDTYNTNGGGWSYFLKNDGWLYARGATNGVGTRVAEVGVAVFNNPGLLYNATGQALPVTGVVANDVLTLTPNPAYVGTVRVTLTVSDGAAKSTRTFLYTTISNPPDVVPVGDQSVTASGAAGSIPVNLAAAFPDNDPLAYSISVVDWLVDAKTKFGLNTPAGQIQPARDNAHFLLSSNGSNVGGSYYFLIKPVNGKYPLLASDGSTSGGTVILEDVGLAVYNNPALLTGATTPAALAGVTAVVNGTTLTIAWPAAYAGMFRVYASAFDGNAEARQSFLVGVA